MLSNAYFLAKFRFDTAENEPVKNLQNFREMHFFEKCIFGSRYWYTSTNDTARPNPPRSLLWRTELGGHGRGRGRASPVRRGAGYLPIFGEFSANFRQNFACSRLYRHRSLQVNTRFAAFLKIYQIIKLTFFEILQNFATFAKCCLIIIFTKIADFSNRCFAKN